MLMIGAFLNTFCGVRSVYSKRQHQRSDNSVMTLAILFSLETRMHSSRMLAVRCSSHLLGVCVSGQVCVCVCVWPGMCVYPGGVCPGGVYAPVHAGIHTPL